MRNKGLGGSSFARRLLRDLESVEYRRIESSEDMEDVGRLRYKAYKSVDLLRMSGTTLIEDLDFDSHAFVFGVYYEERLVSTLRVHHVTPQHRVSSSGEIFPDAVNSLLDSGRTLIDPVRFAADPDFIVEDVALPYLTLRIAAMASDYFDVDMCLSLIKTQHSSFYRRVFQATQLVPPKANCGSYNVDLTLLVSEVRAIRANLYRRYPIFMSHRFEQRMMFGGREEVGPTPLTVLPTARYLAEAA